MRLPALLPLIAVLPLATLAACQVTEDKANGSTEVSVSGDAAVNGVAAGMNDAGAALNGAAATVNDLNNRSGEVQNGVAQLSAGAKALGQAVDHTADHIGQAAKHGAKGQTVVVEKTTTTTTNTSQH